MYDFKDIIADIENGLDGEIDIDELARKANLSNYELRRIFSFLAKIPIGEYIRKRRLSIAAEELRDGKISITELAVKYGYDSPSSFSRAFREFHGISPTEAVNGAASFKTLTRLNTEITVGGGFDLTVTISEKPQFEVTGYSAVSEIDDTECCEGVWDGFYASDIAENAVSQSERLYAVYENGDGYVRCHIGSPECTVGDTVVIPKSTWAIFRLNSTDDSYVNCFYRNINDYWLPSVSYEKRTDVPNIEVFPSDMSEDGFEWEIHIPIKKGN